MAFILSTKKKKIAHILDGRAVVLECGQVLSGDSGGHHWGEEPCKWVAAWETAKHPTGQRTAYSKEVSGPKHQWSMVSEPHTKTQSCNSTGSYVGLPVAALVLQEQSEMVLMWVV